VGTKTNLAFAVWDGSADERNGMKSVSGFATLSVAFDSAPSGTPLPYWVFVNVIVLFVLLGMWMIPRRPKGSAES
jgi:hypothetical protein